MRTKRLEGPLLRALMVSLIASAMSTLPLGTASADGLTPRAPILIEGNSGFTAANGIVAGSGTAGNPYVIEGWVIDASGANGITIRNTTAHFVVRSCHVRGGGELYDGIYLENVRNGRIEGVRSENNRAGINIRYSSNVVIKNTVATNNLFGIYLSNSTGNAVENCIASNNFWQGIYLDNSSSNVVSSSKIQRNLIGINCNENSENNLIRHNNFVNNEIQAHDEGSNRWDDGYPSGGNYWSDYVGVDGDRDGIGDEPYRIAGDNNLDRYPLMNPFEPPVQTPSEGRKWKWPPMEAVAWAATAIGALVAFYMGRVARLRQARLEEAKRRRRREGPERARKRRKGRRSPRKRPR